MALEMYSLEVIYFKKSLKKRHDRDVGGTSCWYHVSTDSSCVRFVQVQPTRSYKWFCCVVFVIL